MGARWKQHEIETLQRMAHEGATYAQISARIDKSEAQIRGAVSRYVTRKALAPLNAKGPLRPFAGNLAFRLCQYIEGKPTDSDSCKCGKATRGGSPWCESHRPLIYSEGRLTIGEE